MFFLKFQEDFAELVYEDVSSISIEKENYYEWIKSKKEISLAP